MTFNISLYSVDKLGRYAEIQPGFAFKSERFTDDPSDVALIKGENVQQGFIDWDASKYWPAGDADTLRNFELRVGDVVLAMDRPWVTAGLKWAYIKRDDPKSLLVQRVARLRAKKGLDQNYLRCLVSSDYFSNYLQPIVTGVNVPHISGKQIGDFKIPLPSYPIQQKIAAIISAYDELIDNNQRRIALLEKMAEEIYREWFVRLRFPGHEKVKIIKGIPEGWEIDRADSIGKIVTGKTPSTDNPRYFGGPYFFIKTPDMHGNIFILETEERLTQNGLDSQPSQTIPRGSICVSCIGTGGVVSITTSECQTNQQINSVIVRNPSDLEWAFFTLRNLREAIQMFGATGATMTNLSKGKFSSLKILRPNKSIVLKYHALVNPIFVQMQSILQQTMILRSTRDLLLPRLISGKLSVEHLDIQFPPGMEESACV